MKGVKDEGKVMDPLFPRLHVNDTDKGGPRAPPRNKMALCAQYNGNASSLSLRNSSGSKAMPPLPVRNGCPAFVPQSSASNSGSLKHKVIPSFSTFPGSSFGGDMDHSYYSSVVNLNNLLKKSETRIPLLPNDQNQHVLADPMAATDCAKKHGHLQMHLDKDHKHAIFCSLSSQKLHNSLNQPKKERSDYQQNLAFGVSKSSQNTDSEQKPFLITPTNTVSSLSLVGNKVPITTTDLSLMNGSNRLCDYRVSQDSEVVTDCTRKRCTSEIGDSACSFSLFGCKSGLTKIAKVRGFSEDKDGNEEDMPVGSFNKKEAFLDSEMEDSTSSLYLVPNEVARVIGQKLFWKARRTIVHQQKVFAVQIFELHRLVKVQRLIAESPAAYDSNFHLKRPSIKFPLMNKLLFVTPLDSSLSMAKPKVDDSQKSSPDEDSTTDMAGKTLQLCLSTSEEQNSEHRSAPAISTPASAPTDGQPAPWCYHPPSGNQWLVPVRSPSEGLIYKPYTGPCPPTAGFMAPVSGNYGPINVNTMYGTSCNVSDPFHLGMNGRLPATALGHSYFQQYAMPVMNTSVSNLEVKQVIPFPAARKLQLSAQDANFTMQYQGSGNVSNQQSGEKLHGSEGSSNMQSSKPSSPNERLQGDLLPLFPTRPSHLEVKDSCEDQRMQVIKVVPHNPKSATDSAARIFLSIQEERKKLR